MDGVSYNDEELETLPASDSCCQPAAAESQLAVSNCHMLKFLAQLGPQSVPQQTWQVQTSKSSAGTE